MDPPRPGATQYALLSISGRSEDTFLINALQLVREEEAEAAKMGMQRLLQLAQDPGGPRRDKQEIVFTPKKCKEVSAVRQVSRSPTEA